MTIPDENEKIRFLNEHFAYEVNMVIAAHQLHNAGATLLQANQIEIVKYLWYKNVGIEGVLMHIRNLIEFFYYKSDKESDYARAIDYLPSWKYTGNMPKDIMRINDRLNTEITHLSWSRLEKNQLTKGWDLNKVAVAFINAALEFIWQIKKEKPNYYQQGLANLENHILIFYT